MTKDYISLIYNNKKIDIKIPNNYSELQDIFLKEFNENINKNFSFFYLSYIDKKSDFPNIMNIIKERTDSFIYVSLENEIEDNSKNKNKIDYFFNRKEDKKIILKSSKIKEYKNIYLTEETKNKNENEYKLFNNGKNNEIFINKNKDLKKEDFNNIDFENMEYITDFKIDSYCYIGLDNTFNVFKSIDNILFLICTNKNNSIISYNLINKRKINEIKKAHNKNITNFRYYLDKIKKRDLIISVSADDNNIKLWNNKNFECLLNLENVNKDSGLYSACFLNENNQNYIITSHCCYYCDNSEYIKIFDFKGTKIKEINGSNEDTFFIDTYYENKLYKNYIITGNNGYCKSYDCKENNIYKIYNDNDDNYHNSIIINDKEEIIKLIESSEDGNIRIWNFHSGELIKKIKVNKKKLYSIILWNNDYIFVGCEDKTIKLINLNNEKNIKSLFGHNNYVLTLKKIFHPIYREILISQSFKEDKIKLWINKNY